MISVVIPVHNRASIIQETIDNMLEQTYQDIEIIVVDDGSTDDLAEAMKKYEGPESKVRLIGYETNRGACYARNYGIREARGEYIALQDSDDLWSPEKLELQKAFLENEGLDVCICGMDLVDIDGHATGYHPAGFCTESMTLERELTCNFISTQLLFGHKKCFLEEPFDVEFPRFQDWDIGIRLVKRYRMGYLNKRLAQRIVRGDSISRSKENTCKAIRMILTKYKSDYAKYPKAEAYVLDDYARKAAEIGLPHRKALKRALKSDFSPKRLLKYGMAVTGIYGMVIRKKHSASKSK